MPTFLYNFFHNETNDRSEKGLIRIPKNKEEWPEAWKKIHCKRYSLFKAIPLPSTDGVLFKTLLQPRRSSEKYILGNRLSLTALSYILHCGYGLQGEDNEKERDIHRTVPSAGTLYPLEIYLFLFKQADSCLPGIYHYNLQENSLEPVIKREFSSEDIRSIAPEQEWLQGTNGMICITSVFQRTIQKYGSRGYRYILLEAGHVAQNILLAGTEKGINVIPIGGTEALQIETMLGLSSKEEGVIYTLFL